LVYELDDLTRDCWIDLGVESSHGDHLVDLYLWIHVFVVVRIDTRRISRGIFMGGCILPALGTALYGSRDHRIDWDDLDAYRDSILIWME
jgi:hypothetical protein